MNIFAVISLMNAIVSLIMGDLIFHENRESKYNRSFALLCGFLALWAFSEFMYRQAGVVGAATFWIDVNKLTWRFTLAALISFVLIFSNISNKVARPLMFMTYVSVIFFSVMDFSTAEISGGPLKAFWGYTYLPKTTLLSDVSRLWAAGLAITALSIVIRFYIMSPSGEQKGKAGIVSFALLIPIAVGLFELAISAMGLRFPEPTTASFTWLAIFIGYASRKFNLFVVSPEIAATSIVDNMTDGLFLGDREDKIVMINQAGRLLLKSKSVDLSGMPLEKLFRDFSSWKVLNGKLAIGKQLRNFETAFLTRAGNPVDVMISASPVKNDRGQIAGSVIIAKDMSEFKKSKKFRFLAYHDPLTGLPNRMLLKDRLNQALAFAERAGTSLAVLFIDLDDFKKINDTYGHNVGDILLRDISERIRQVMRRGDTLAREGGDEFTYIAVNLSEKNDVKKIANRIIFEISKPFRLGHCEISTSVTIGISVLRADGARGDELIDRADSALLRAKKSGKGYYRFYDDRSAA